MEPAGGVRLDVAVSKPGLLDRQHFAMRRVHSLTGIVPVGLFLINHMLANSTAFLGPGHFDHHVGLIHSLPWLVWVETLFIFIPMAFHGIYGLVIALQGRPNAVQYPYMDNWRYTLQRVTAYIMVVFIVVHLVHFRFADWFGVADSYAAANPTFYAFTHQGFHGTLMGLSVWVWMVVYAIGLLATVFHFANGIVTFCITWGITVGDESRKKMSVVAGALGIVLLLWGVLSLVAFARLEVPQDDGGHGGHAVGTQQVDAAPPAM